MNTIQDHKKGSNTPGSSGRLFKSGFLEALTHAHISIPLTIFYGSAAVLILYSLYLGFIAPLSNIYLFFAGVFVFTLAEYLVHRFVFHIGIETPAKERFQYLFHGVHHDFPKDKSRLAMPPVPSILLALTFFGLYRLIMGYYGLPFTAGFLTGYAGYLCIHYAVHAYHPPKNFFRFLWAYHAIHHFQQPEAAFGVSSPFWDYVFNTNPVKNPKRKEAEA